MQMVRAEEWASEGAWGNSAPELRPWIVEIGGSRVSSAGWGDCANQPPRCAAGGEPVEDGRRPGQREKEDKRHRNHQGPECPCRGSDSSARKLRPKAEGEKLDTKQHAC